MSIGEILYWRKQSYGIFTYFLSGLVCNLYLWDNHASFVVLTISRKQQMRRNSINLGQTFCHWLRWLSCLQVHSTVADLIPAGGHQMYAPLGGVFSQSRPLNLHVYGDLYTQKMDTLVGIILPCADKYPYAKSIVHFIKTIISGVKLISTVYTQLK